MAKAVKDETIKIDSSEITIFPAEVEKKVNAEIGLIRVEANVTEEVIRQLTEEYSGLKIKDQSDKEGYIAVQEARKHVKKIRVAAGKLFDKGREEAVAVANKWLTSKKKVVDALSAIETPLEEQEDAYEAEDKRIKQEKAAKLEQQRIERTEDMIRFGARIEANGWVLGDLAYETILVAHCDPEIYAGIKAEYKSIFDANEKAKAEQIEKDRLAQEKLQKDQEDLKRLQKEVKDMRTEGRISFLKSLGMGAILDGDNEAFGYGKTIVRLWDIEEKEAQDWEVIIAGVKEGIDNAKVAQKEKDRVDKVFQDRLPKLRMWAYNGFTVSRPTNLEGSMDIFGSKEDLVGVPDAVFGEMIADNEATISKWEEKKEEKQKLALENARLEGIGKSRRQVLLAIGVSADPTDLELGGLAEDKWNFLYGEYKAAYDKKQKDDAAQKEKERLEELGEKGRYEELVKYLKAAPIGEYRSSQYRTKVSPIRQFIEGIK